MGRLVNDRCGMIHLCFYPDAVSVAFRGVSNSLAVDAPPELNEAKPIPKCHQDAIKVTIYVKLK